MREKPESGRSGAPGRLGGRRGLALVTVLWVLMLLSLMAASFLRSTRTEVNLTRNLIGNAEAEALADAGVERAILGLVADRQRLPLGDDVQPLNGERPTAEATQETEADPEAPVAEEAAEPLWRSDGTVYTWRYGAGEVRIAIQDEAGKIDLNAGAEALLRGLFLSATWSGPDGETLGLDAREAEALVDAVRDFADPDDLVRANGAEDRNYAAAGMPWDAKDAPFEAVAELQQVLGMTGALYEAVAPALTVHTGQAGIDPSKAPRQVLLALPGSESTLVDEHLAARAQALEGQGPVFAGAENLSEPSRRGVLSIHAEARTAAGAVFARRAVVRLGGETGARVLEWVQGSRRLFPFEDGAPEEATAGP